MNNKYIKRDLIITYISLALTIVLFLYYSYFTVPILKQYFYTGDHIAIFLYTLLMLIILGFVYGSIVYHLTRIGYLKRKKLLKENTKLNTSSPLTILVPSYKEEIRTIKQTLISLALLDYPKKRLVLLIDNPPNPTDNQDRLLLEETYYMVEKLNDKFLNFKKRLNNSLKDITNNKTKKVSNKKKILRDINIIETWFLNIENKYNKDHVDNFFISNIISEYVTSIKSIKRKIKKEKDSGEIKRHLNLLLNYFNTEITYFERKKYLNLSHEANKAMNLNSYLGLMGNDYSIKKTKKGNLLKKTSSDKADISVPSTEYILTVDADSLIKKDYAKTLVSKMESNKEIAVAQTPYCSYKSSDLLERTAGATTDIQYNIHQGFGYFNSAYWVGANAILRRKALDDILVETTENKYKVKRYVQDRTVIEDTESSLDLRVLGWTIYNHPKKLAFSATPADFGSLVIQRRRWANGGLIIFPKLLKYFFKNPFKKGKISEFFIRSHYLLSIFIVNYGFILLITLPFDRELNNPLLPLLAIPYLFIYSIDLQKLGYKWYEMFRVYSFNLLLVPVNIIGVNKSIEQLVFNKKIPFMRTPKIGSRTPASLNILILEYLLLALLFISVYVNMINKNYFISTFALINLLGLIYAIKLIGFSNSLKDIKNQLVYYFSKINFLKEKNILPQLLKSEKAHN